MPSFDIFSNLCEELSNSNSRNFKRQVFVEFCKNNNSEICRKVTYLFQGATSSAIDYSVFNFSAGNIIKAIKQNFNLNEDIIQEKMKIYGDLGTVLFNLSKNTNTELTFLEVFDQISSLALISGKNSLSKKIDILCNLFNKCSNLASKYIVRIVLGELRVGMSEKTILDACSVLSNEKLKYSFLEDAFAVQSDLGLIVEKTIDNNYEYILNISPKLGIAIKPETAERMDEIESIFSKMSLPLYVQPKYDGFRYQIHISNNQIVAFSRNLININGMFPEIEEALLNKFKNIENIILDGEIVSFDEEKNTFLSFQETAVRKRKKDIEKYLKTHPLNFIVFDILYLNNESKLNLIYEERLNLIENIFSKTENRLEIKIVENFKINSVEELIKLNNLYKKKEFEGIMIKNASSIYKPGKRTKDWIKWKNIQSTMLGDTIDTVVLGYYLGQGKRLEQGIGAIIVGIYDSENDIYKSIAKVGTGMSTETWISLVSDCNRFASKDMPKNVLISKNLIPDVFCYPKIVVSLEADLISNSTEHSSGFSLRFPRLIGIRNDKNEKNCTNLLEIKSLAK